MSPITSYLADKQSIDAAIQRVMQSGAYIMGPEVEAFEQEFAAWLSVDQVVGCANGTDALVLALQACDLPPGSRVATVSHTAVATVAAIEIAGHRPVLLDVDASYTLDVEELETILQAKSADPIRAVIVVHLYGQPADIIGIGALCERYGAALIEDCSQAHGAMVGDRKVGSFGRASTFSFYPTKNLGGYGDGGAVATSDPACAKNARRLRQYGWDFERNSQVVGRNSRLDELQAAILRVKLASLQAANARRREIAALYNGLLDGGLITLPPLRESTTPVFHQYVIQSTARDKLKRDLADRGIETAIHYPLPAHLQVAYLDRVELGPLHCRRSQELSRRILSLPMSAELTDDYVSTVGGAVRELTLAS